MMPNSLQSQKNALREINGPKLPLRSVKSVPNTKFLLDYYIIPRDTPSVASVDIGDGVRMPLFGLGTSRNSSYDSIYETIDTALACGYRLFDTATKYDNEDFIGDALQLLLPKYGLMRADVFITTKLYRQSMGGMNRGYEALKRSLARLKTDYVDLYLIHHPKPSWTQDVDTRNAQVRRETWLEMETLKNLGLCRAIGVSNFTVAHLREMEAYASVFPSVNQCEFHPHFTRKELIEYCSNNKIMFQAFSSLGRANPDLLDEPYLVGLAEKYNVTVSQVLLAWAFQQNIGVIPKSCNPVRIKENWEAIKLKLSEHEISELWKLNKDSSYSTCKPWFVL